MAVTVPRERQRTVAELLLRDGKLTMSEIGKALSIKDRQKIRFWRNRAGITAVNWRRTHAAFIQGEVRAALDRSK